MSDYGMRYGPLPPDFALFVLGAFIVGGLIGLLLLFIIRWEERR